MLDFLLLIQNVSSDVNVAYIPLLLAGITAASSIAGGVSAAKAAEDQAIRAGTRAERDRNEAARRLAALRRGELDTPIQKQLMSQATMQALGTGLSRAAEDQAAEAREQALATAAMGGTPMSALSGDAYGDFAREQALKGLTGRQKSLADFGTTQETIQAANVADFNTQLKAEMGDARRLERMGIVGGDMAEDARLEAQRQKNQAIVQGLASGVSAGLGVGFEAGYDTVFSQGEVGQEGFRQGMFGGDPNARLPRFEEGGMFEDASDSAAAAYNLGSYYGEQIEAAKDQGRTQFDAMLEMVKDRFNPDRNVDDEETEKIQENIKEQGARGGKDTKSNQAFRNSEEGGKYKFRDGGGVMVTDGEFDHDTNKKAIVDEETGVKEGEMTGQEALVFNDEQVAMIEKLTNAGDQKGLMKFMRELLSRPEFQGEV